MKRALELAPDAVEAKRRVAWLLSTTPDVNDRNAEQALKLAIEITDDNPNPNEQDFAILAAAYAESGEFDKAIKEANHAMELATPAHNHPLEAELKRHLEAYNQGQPFRSNNSNIHNQSHGHDHNHNQPYRRLNRHRIQDDEFTTKANV